jgi:hypothetical protein
MWYSVFIHPSAQDGRGVIGGLSLQQTTFDRYHIMAAAAVKAGNRIAVRSARNGKNRLIPVAVYVLRSNYLVGAEVKIAYALKSVVHSPELDVQL